MANPTEIAILDCLSSISNSSDRNGPSVQLKSPFLNPEERLERRTPLMVDFLDRVNKQCHTDGGHILDVGCGRGNDSALLIRKGYKLVSCDISEEMLRLAAESKASLVQNGHKEFEHWEIFQADMCDLYEAISSREKTPKQYDCIVCVACVTLILNLDDLKRALEGFKKLLRPGGLLILDHRNFLPMVTRGKANNRGYLPSGLEEHAGWSDLIPYPIFRPGPERQPLAVFMDYKLPDGHSVYITSRYLTPELFTSYFKSIFGESCKIEILNDLKTEEEVSTEDACIFTYVVEKPVE